MYEKLIKEYFDAFKDCAEWHFKGEANNKSRKREHIEARQAVWLAMDENGYPYQKIYRLTPFDRANVLCGIRAGLNLLETDERFRKKYEAILKLEYTDFDKEELIKYYTAKILEYSTKIKQLKHA